MTVYSLFLETDYVNFQKNELVVSDNEHEYFFKTSYLFGKLIYWGWKPSAISVINHDRDSSSAWPEDPLIPLAAKSLAANEAWP